MNSERFLEALGQVDESLLNLCDAYVPAAHHPWRWISAAACVAIAAVSAVVALHGKPLPVEPVPETGTVAALFTEGESSTLSTTESNDLTTLPDCAEPATKDESSQIHLPCETYPGTTKSNGSGTRDGAPYKSPEGETALEVPFDKAPTYATKYPTLVLNGQNYTSRGTSEPIFSHQLKRKATLTGFDGVHKTEVELYELKGISRDAAVGVRFPESNESYTYVNTDYLPATLGQFMDDLNMNEYMGYGKVYFGYHDYSWPPVAEFKKLMNRSAACTNSEASWSKDVLYFNVDIPVLGYTHCMFALTSDGYLHTNLLESSKTFYVGKDRVDAFLQYVHCEPTSRLAVATTGAYTSVCHVPTATTPDYVIECH